MADTPNIRLKKPTKGDPNWDVPMNANLDEIDSQVGALNTQAQGFQTSITQNTTDLAGLKPTVAQHTTDIAQLKANPGGMTTAQLEQMSQNTADIAGLKTQDGAHTTAIAALQAKDAAHDTSITSLTSSVNTQATQITGLQTKDTTHDTQIAALQADLDALQSPARTFVTYQVTLSATAARIDAADYPADRIYTVENVGQFAIWVGNSATTADASNGFRLEPGDIFKITLTASGEIWGVSTFGNAQVSVVRAH